MGGFKYNHHSLELGCRYTFSGLVMHLLETIKAKVDNLFVLFTQIEESYDHEKTLIDSIGFFFKDCMDDSLISLSSSDFALLQDLFLEWKNKSDELANSFNKDHDRFVKLIDLTIVRKAEIIRTPNNNSNLSELNLLQTELKKLFLDIRQWGKTLTLFQLEMFKNVIEKAQFLSKNLSLKWQKKSDYVYSKFCQIVQNLLAKIDLFNNRSCRPKSGFDSCWFSEQEKKQTNETSSVEKRNDIPKSELIEKWNKKNVSTNDWPNKNRYNTEDYFDPITTKKIEKISNNVQPLYKSNAENNLFDHNSPKNKITENLRKRFNSQIQRITNQCASFDCPNIGDEKNVKVHPNENLLIKQQTPINCKDKLNKEITRRTDSQSNWRFLIDEMCSIKKTNERLYDKFRKELTNRDQKVNSLIEENKILRYNNRILNQFALQNNQLIYARMLELMNSIACLSEKLKYSNNSENNFDVKWRYIDNKKRVQYFLIGCSQIIISVKHILELLKRIYLQNLTQLSTLRSENLTI